MVFLTSKEAAELLRIEEETLRRWARSGQIRVYEVGTGKRRELRFQKKDILAAIRPVRRADPAA